MHFIKYRKLIQWIAALAILLGALAPTVSQALSVSQSGKGFVVEICSANGSKMTQIIGDDESSVPSAMGGHCPYCVVQPIYLLPSVSAFEFSAPQSYGTQSLTSHQAFQIQSAWVRLPSRGPPAKS